MTVQPDRGDCGAVPDPSWEAKWSRWNSDDVQRYIADAAGFGPLSWAQALALLQGLPPPPPGWQPPTTVLAEFEGIAQRLREDMTRGIMSSTPTPDELAAWCDARRHALPEPFVRSLRVRTTVPAEALPRPQSSTVWKPPAWVPLPQVTPPKTTAKRKPGRPKTEAAAVNALVGEARRILMARAADGEVVTLPEIAKQLAATPLTGSKTTSTILRGLKGRLPVKVAKEKVQAVLARQRAVQREATSSGTSQKRE